MSQTQAPERRLHIRKYANRRFYDTTRSCHVKLTDLHELVRDGWELHVTDSSTGEDITNQVLTQILLEREAAKLTVFPSAILHEMIRTQQQFLGNVVEQFFRHALQAHRDSQQRWNAFLRRVLGNTAADPFDWSRAMMDAFSPSLVTPPTQPPPADAAASTAHGEIDSLRAQVERLSQQLEAMTARKKSAARKRRAKRRG